MNLVDIIYPVIAIGGMGLVFAIGLGIAAEKFQVPKDERVEEVRENLPGANCGGCGFAGCDAFAKAVAEGAAKINGCPVCTQEQIQKIAEVMGQTAEVGKKKVAFVRCKGTIDKAKQKYIYNGVESCLDAHLVGGGSKGCSFGCLGLGSCIKACAFDAMNLENGIAIVNEEKCTACGACVKACPRNIIEIIPQGAPVQVACVSKAKGKEVKAVCEIGCIGCGLCVKQCESNAIIMENNLAHIDPERCINCGKCAPKCPTKAIHTF